MRSVLVIAILSTACSFALPVSLEAAPAPLLVHGPAIAPLRERVQYYPPNTYRPYGYYVPAPAPAPGVVTQAPIADGSYVPPAPVVPAQPAPATSAPVTPAPPAAATTTQAPAVVPSAPIAAVVPTPVIVVPARPASCGQFKFWNGFACVDARFNEPYLGPRP